MSSAQMGRIATVAAPRDAVRDRLRSFARVNGYEVRSERDGRVELTRGSKLAAIYTFDPGKVPTVLTVELTETDGQSEVVVSLNVGSPLVMFTSGDRVALESHLDALLAALSA